jgi:two-component system LytT family response regulator
MKIKALIVDDEPQSRDLLEKQIQHFFSEIEVVGKAGDGKEAARLIHQFQPNVVFLDVEMRGETGFDILKAIGEVTFDVVFTTGHEKYALEAIRFSALDYLMKPILADELKRAISRVLEKGNEQDRHRHLDALVYNINYSNADKKIALPTMGGYEFVSISEVVHCEAKGNYTLFHLKNQSSLLVSRTLLEFENLLSNYHFIRIHHARLINLRHAARYVKGDGGLLIMSDGSEMEVSRRKKQDLIQALSEFSLIL